MIVKAMDISHFFHRQCFNHNDRLFSRQSVYFEIAFWFNLFTMSSTSNQKEETANT